MSHNIFRLQRALACAKHIQEKLAVWKTILKFISKSQGQSGFAYSAHAPQPGDGCALAELLKKPFDIILPTCEVQRRRRNLMRNRQNRGRT